MNSVNNNITKIIEDKLHEGYTTLCGIPVTYIRRPATWMPNFLNSHRILSKHFDNDTMVKIQNNTHIQVRNIDIQLIRGRITRTLRNETS